MALGEVAGSNSLKAVMAAGEYRWKNGVLVEKALNGDRFGKVVSHMNVNENVFGEDSGDVGINEAFLNESGKESNGLKKITKGKSINAAQSGHSSHASPPHPTWSATPTPQAATPSLLDRNTSFSLSFFPTPTRQD
ncbi:hypothetical protein GBA52_016469 [Prunus armeniaca]|nr:hypothetical protein GBA52_016469 [Prunus armeniaca]